MTRASHHPPAVRYPVARLRGVLGCIAATVLGGLALLVAWAMQSAAPVALAGGVFCVWFITSALALHVWWRGPTGALAWDGQQWTLECSPSTAAMGQVHVVLDLQRFLLLQWNPLQGRAAWMTLERSQHPAAWNDVRRAVYSRPRPQASGVGAEPLAPRDGA